MNQSLVLKRLCWKEIRQLIPLAGMLMLILPLLFLLFMLGGSARDNNFGILAGFAGPGIFAIGAATILISHEKETRSLDWLRSLPVSPFRIVTVKLGVCLAGTLCLWLVLVLFASMLSHTMRWIPDNTELLNNWDVAGWILNSFNLVGISSLAAWRAKSTMRGLIAIAPLAVIPSLLTYIHLTVTGSYWLAPSTPIISNLYLLGCTLISLVLAVLSGQRWLAPTRVITNPTWTIFDTHPVVRERPYSLAPTSALLWQFAKQNRLSLIISLVLLAGAVAYQPEKLAGYEESFVRFFFVLLVTYHGLLVFQSDSNNHRSQFLAQLGIAPTRVWATRHAFPIMLLWLDIAVVHFAPLTSEVFSPLRDQWLSLTLIGLSTYSLAQWMGQLILSPVIKRCSLPLVAILSFGVTMLPIMVVGLPIGWLTPLIAIPLLLTWLSTPPWLDQRRGRRYWLLQTTGAVITAAIIMAPLGFIAWSPSPLKLATVRQLTSLADSTPNTLRPNTTRNPYNDSTLDNHLRFTDLREWELHRLRSDIEALEQDTPYLPTQWNLASWIAQGNRDRLGTQAGNETSERHYRLGLQRLLLAHQHLRQSTNLRDQTTADNIEMWWVSELADQDAAEVMPADLHEQILERLGDSETRHLRRKIAVAKSWEAAKDSPQDSYLVGIFGAFPKDATFFAAARARRVRDTVVSLLWQDLMNDGNNHDQIQLEIGRAMGQSPKFQTMNQRLAQITGDRLFLPSRTSRTPGAQWYGPWETKAAQLATETGLNQ